MFEYFSIVLGKWLGFSDEPGKALFSLFKVMEYGLYLKICSPTYFQTQLHLSNMQWKEKRRGQSLVLDTASNKNLHFSQTGRRVYSQQF